MPHESVFLARLLGSLQEPDRPVWVVSDDSGADVVIINEEASDAATSYCITSELTWGRPVGQLGMPLDPATGRPATAAATAATTAPSEHWKECAQRLLSGMEDKLADLVAWHTLAQAVYQHHAAGHPCKHLWNLELENHLVAVVDFKRQVVGLHPQAIEFTPDFADISWVRKPSTALIPEEFVTQRLAHVLWQFAKRSKLDLLPPEYRTQKICLKSLPHLLVQDLSSLEIAVINYMVQYKVCTLQDMERDLGLDLELDAKVLDRCVAGLFLAGALDTEKPRSGLFHQLQQLMGKQNPPSGTGAKPTPNGFHGDFAPSEAGIFPLTDYPSLN